MIRWFAKNDIATNIIMIAILLGGIYVCFFKLPVEIEPSYSLKHVDIDVTVRGWTAEDVEEKITIPIENAVKDINGVKSTRAWINNGSTDIDVFPQEGTDLDILKQEVEATVNALSSLPVDSDRKIWVPDDSLWKEVITVIITGNMSTQDLERVAMQVRDDLTAMPEISRAVIQGRSQREISIEPRLDQLQAYDISLKDISDAIKANSIDSTAGTLRIGGSGIKIRSSKQATTKEEFSRIIIKRVNGSDITVGEVANVIDDFTSASNKVIRFQDEKCALVEVFRLHDQNAIKIADAVNDYVANAEDKFPAGIKLHTWDDNTVSLRTRIKTLTNNLLQGAVLVLIMLTLFLRPSLAFWVVMGVPISFAGGCILMYFLGVSINLWTLFGFIIVLGIVVDDAIVTAENIYSKHRLGMTSLEASVEGTKEVATPVTFGIITTIVAFIPLLYLSGWQGNIAKQIPFVIIPVLIFSLIESKFILPAHLKHIKTGRKPSKWNILTRAQQSIARGLEIAIDKVYQPALKLAVSFRYAVVALFIVVSCITFAYFKSDAFEKEDLPRVDRYKVLAKLQMNDNVELADTEKQLRQIYNQLDTLREEFMDGNTGNSLIGNAMFSAGGHAFSKYTDIRTGYIYIEITPPSFRSVPGPDNNTIAKRWIELVGEIPDAKEFTIFSQKSGNRNRRDSDNIEIELKGGTRENRDQAVGEISDWIKEQEYNSSTYTTRTNLKKEISVSLKPQGAELGLTEESLATQMRNSFFGVQAQRFQLGEEDLRIMVRLPEDDRKSVHTLETMNIRLPNGTYTALSNVAEFGLNQTSPWIYRANGSRIVTLQTSIDPDFKGKLDSLILPGIEAHANEVLQKYPGISWYYVGAMAERKEANQRILFGMIALIFTLYALLAIPFKSILQPLFVMMAVPLGIIGALIGHIIMDFTPSYLSIFGVLALCGVVVNDSLVMVDFINQKRKEGADLNLAVIHSGTKRFRAIMLTSVTTFAGLFPIILEQSIESQFLKPMAISLAFGILFATVITLFLIPCAYLVTEDIKRALSWYFRGSKKEVSTQE